METYTAPAVCGNCGWRGEVTSDKGTEVNLTPCPNCRTPRLYGASPHRTTATEIPATEVSAQEYQWPWKQVTWTTEAPNPSRVPVGDDANRPCFECAAFGSFDALNSFSPCYPTCPYVHPSQDDVKPVIRGGYCSECGTKLLFQSTAQPCPYCGSLKSPEVPEPPKCQHEKITCHSLPEHHSEVLTFSCQSCPNTWRHVASPEAPFWSNPGNMAPRLQQIAKACGYGPDHPTT